MGQAILRVVSMLAFALSAPLPLVGSATAGGYSYDKDFFCGVPVLVSEYALELQDATIVMPELGQFFVDGRSIYEARFQERWATKYTGAGVFFYDDITLLLQFREDCVDLYASRIYVFDRQGRLMVSDDVWAAHWEAGFYFDEDRLNFWSEWFCSEHNEDAQTASYVMQLPAKSSEFVRVARTREENCSPQAIEDLRARRIAFDWFSPDKTLIRDPRSK